MIRRQRPLAFGAALSLGVHLLGLYGVPRLERPPPVDSRPLRTIDARIVTLLPPSAATPALAAKKTPAAARTAVRSAPRSSEAARPDTLTAAVAPVATAPAPSAPVAPVLEGTPDEAPAPGTATAAVEAPAAFQGGPMQTAPAHAAEAVPAATPTPHAEYPVRAARLVFDLYFGATPSKVGQVTHSWTYDGARYQAETVAEAIGFVSLFFGARFVQRSSGLVTAEGLAPAEYHAELGSAARTETARFDWAAGTLALVAKGEERVVELPAGAQDPLSTLHQLYFMQPLPDPSRFDIATGRKLYRYVYRVVGETALETPLGVVRALHLQRRDSDGARMDVWLDLDRELLPARIHSVDRRGLVLEQVIREARLDLAAATR